MTDTLATPGQLRGLDRLAGADGLIVGAAVDHRDALERILAARGINSSHAQRTALKRLIAATLAPHATMTLFDIESGAADLIRDGVIPPRVGIAVPLEANGYGAMHEIAETRLLVDVDPDVVRRLGADAAKLLLPFRLDRPEQAARQEEIARRVCDACGAAGIALVLEPVAYPVPGEALPPEDFSRLVIEGARCLAPFGPTLLKVQYPGTPEACSELDHACGPVPWVLLGGGERPERLLRQVRDACAAGASGAIVGRTLFDAALTLDPRECETALVDTGIPLLEALTSAVQSGRPVRGRAS